MSDEEFARFYHDLAEALARALITTHREWRIAFSPLIVCINRYTISTKATKRHVLEIHLTWERSQ